MDEPIVFEILDEVTHLMRKKFKARRKDYCVDRRASEVRFKVKGEKDDIVIIIARDGA